MRRPWTNARIGAEPAEFLDETLFAEWPLATRFETQDVHPSAGQWRTTSGTQTWRESVGLSADAEKRRGHGLERRIEEELEPAPRHWFARCYDAQLARRVRERLAVREPRPTTAQWHTLGAVTVLAAIIATRSAPPAGRSAWASPILGPGRATAATPTRRTRPTKLRRAHGGPASRPAGLGEEKLRESGGCALREPDPRTQVFAEDGDEEEECTVLDLTAEPLDALGLHYARLADGRKHLPDVLAKIRASDPTYLATEIAPHPSGRRGAAQLHVVRATGERRQRLLRDHTRRRLTSGVSG